MKKSITDKGLFINCVNELYEYFSGNFFFIDYLCSNYGKKILIQRNAFIYLEKKLKNYMEKNLVI